MRSRLMVLLAVLAGGPGCTDLFGDILGKACTEIGCSSGLTVEIQSNPVGPWTVEVTAPNEPTMSVTCSASQHCGNAFFPDFLPASVTITVTYQGRTTTTTAQPQTRLVKPNGGDCPPTCNQPLVVVAKP